MCYQHDPNCWNLTIHHLVLFVSVGSVTNMVIFLIVNFSLSYHAIPGRTWIHQMKAIPLSSEDVICYSLRGYGYIR